jgi:hypothetical protein
MPAKGASRAHFVGHQQIATGAAIDAWVRRAKSGDRFTYCEAPEPMRFDAWLRAPELEQQGLVHLRQERREGGGYRWFVVRTAKAMQAPQSAAEKALADEATARIHADVCQAASQGRFCPSDAELARRAGLFSRDQAQWRVRRLVDAGVIKSELIYRAGVPTRVVTILATGKSTARPDLKGDAA